ncbi:hypothetical protein FB451DRAFT_1282607 [Mycena latifolia]|nr:hypothetical protein FB451DRAFT_1282607 [Mycena latifolia]
MSGGGKFLMDLSDSVSPEDLRKDFAQVRGIPENWHESWETLRAALQELEDRGEEPHAAVASLLQADVKRQAAGSVDDSSVAHLKNSLGTNYAPTESERKQIQVFCAQGLRRISEVTAEIEIDRRRLRYSDARRMVLQELVDPFLALLSPMRAMPPEILQEIFMACLPADHNAVMDTSEAPLIFGRVSSAWRSISLSTAALWSSVHVVIPRPTWPSPSLFSEEPSQPVSPLNVLQRQEGFRIWLQRASDCSLSISLFNNSYMPGITREFMAIMTPHSRRLKALKLPGDALYDLRSLCPEDVSSLEVLEIFDNAWTTTNADGLRFLAIPPNLTTVSVVCVTAQPLPLRSWDRVTNLVLTCSMSFFTVDLHHILLLLAQFTNLETCRLHNGDRDLTASQSAPLRQVTLSRLHTLFVRAPMAVAPTFSLPDLLDSLVLPALQQLSLSNSFPGEVVEPLDMMLALEGLVLRSSCNLRSLSVRQAPGDAGSLLRCLRHVPGLMKLSLDQTPDFSFSPPELLPIFQQLIVSPSSATPSLCPSLLHLRLIRCDSSPAAHPVLESLIQSRCQPVAQGVAPLGTMDLVLQHAWSLDRMALGEPMRSTVNIVDPPPPPPMPWATRWQGISEVQEDPW